MTLYSRHIISILVFMALGLQSVHAQFDLMTARPADRVAASKFFAVTNNQISTYETSNLSLPVSTSTSGILFVESTQKTTAVQEGAAVPREFALSQNFPNPFNMSTKILYSIPVQAQVSLVVYDITGREIATLVHGQLSPGAYAAYFDINTIASGTYYYRMIAVGQSGTASVETKKMIVMK